MTTAPQTAPQATAPLAGTERLVMRRTLPASPERVFDAWTKPDLVERWFSPGAMTVAEASLDVRVGGSFRIVMTSPEGEPHTPVGVYEEIVPNEKLVFSWRWLDDELVTRVTVELRAVGPQETELTLTHEGFPDRSLRDRHDEGWAGCLAKLPAVLAAALGERASHGDAS